MKKNIKILLLTEYFPPETGAGATRAFEHSKRWVNAGAEVTVLTCMPHYPTGIIPPKYKGKLLYREEFEGVQIIRTFTYAVASKGFFKRFFAYFAFMVSSIVQGAIILGKYDLLIATSPPFSIGISGLILSKLKKIPLVLEVRDLWPESLIQLGRIKSKMLIFILEWLELKIYNTAELIISVTDSYCPIISRKGIDPNKIKVIKNGVDVDFFHPLEKDIELINKLKYKEKTIVSYFGNFGLSQPIDKIIDVARMIKDRKEIQFLLIGDGERRREIIMSIEKFDLVNVTILNSVSKEELRKYYSISDLMIVPLQNIPLFKTVIPSKIFEIMAMGKMILLGVEGEAKSIVESANSGRFFEPENAEDMKNKILEICNSKNRINEYGNHGRVFVENKFDRNKIAIDYLELLKVHMQKKREIIKVGL